MNYKHFIILLVALLLDITIGIFFVHLGPIFLIFATVYFALTLDYFDALVLAFVSGFLYDLSFLSSSIFYSIFFILMTLAIKILGRKAIDFSGPISQLLTIITFFSIRMMVFYLVYDRSLNSIFLIHNLIAIACGIITFAIANFLSLRLYAKKN